MSEVAPNDLEHPRLESFSQRDLLVTLVYDGAILMAAVLIRGALLWVLEYAVPEGTENWSIKALSWISDVGLIVTAALFTAFDVLKRVVISFKSLQKAMRS